MIRNPRKFPEGRNAFHRSFPSTIIIVNAIQTPELYTTPDSRLHPRHLRWHRPLQDQHDGRQRTLAQNHNDPNSSGGGTGFHTVPPSPGLRAGREPPARRPGARAPAPTPPGSRYPESRRAPGGKAGGSGPGAAATAATPGRRASKRASAAFPHTKWRPAHLGSTPPGDPAGRPPLGLVRHPTPPRAAPCHAHSPQPRRGGPKAERE